MNPNEKQWWVFTFSVGQKYGGHYVQFFGTHEEARDKMVKWFGLEWAFQYSEARWEENVARMASRGRTQWIERALTRAEYAAGRGVSTIEKPHKVVDEEFLEKMQTFAG